MIDDSKILYKKAIDVQPHLHALVCSYPGSGGPCGIEIVHRRWNEDGTRIIFGLDSHNMVAYPPEMELPVIMHEGVNFENERLDLLLYEDAKRMANRPQPTVACPCCAGKGKVPKVPAEFTEGVWVEGGATYEVVDGQIVRRL